MTRKKTLKIALKLFVIIVLIGGSVGYYLYNMPHRDVQATKTDFVLKSSDIVSEYLANPALANEKYLDEEGESKVIEITGKIHQISTDFNDNKVVILKSETDKAGVSCTFFAATNSKTAKLQIGNMVTIKGVIRAGAAFDKDLDMYEDVIMEKCDIVSN